MRPTAAISALLRLHGDLASKIDDNKREAKRLADSMRHVEAVIKLLQPGYNLRAISVRRRKPNRWVRARHDIPKRPGRSQDG